MADQTPDQLIAAIVAGQLAMQQQIAALAAGQVANQDNLEAKQEYFHDVTEANRERDQKILEAQIRRATRVRPRDR